MIKRYLAAVVGAPVVGRAVGARDGATDAALAAVGAAVGLVEDGTGVGALLPGRATGGI